MAEIKMSYDELQRYVNDIINSLPRNVELLNSYKTAILTALTGVFDDSETLNKAEENLLMELWNNHQNAKSQVLLGKKYIRIHDFMLDFLERFLTGGMFDVIVGINNGIVAENAVTFTAVSSIIWSMVSIFRKAVSLDDSDFCLYLQIVTHFYEKKEFTKHDAISWFPMNKICNMHNKKWNCFYHEGNDTCSVTEDIIEKILESLIKKGVIDKQIKNKEIFYNVKN